MVKGYSMARKGKLESTNDRFSGTLLSYKNQLNKVKDREKRDNKPIRYAWVNSMISWLEGSTNGEWSKDRYSLTSGTKVNTWELLLFTFLPITIFLFIFLR